MKMRQVKPHGVTLIELIITILLLAGGFAGIAQLYAFIAKSGVSDRDVELQRLTQLSQACASSLLTEKRLANPVLANFSALERDCKPLGAICTPTPKTVLGGTSTSGACTVTVLLKEPDDGYAITTLVDFVGAADSPRIEACPAGIECLNISVTSKNISKSVVSEMAIVLANY